MKHFYEKIPGWSGFLPLYTEMVERAPQTGAVFVEIGTWEGRSAAFMAVEIVNSGKEIDFYAVDHFQGSAELQEEDVVVRGTLLQTFMENMRPVLGCNLLVLAMPSLEAAARFEDGAVNFAFIDGAHDYKSARDDINAWLPKIAPGGVLAGDDFCEPGVNKAVRELLPRFEKFNHGGATGWRVTKELK